MKKVTALATSALGYLALARMALAQDTVTPCPDGTGGNSDQFANLCNFSQFSVGQVVSTVIIILLIVAVIIAVVFLIIGGIRWILSGGDKGAVESARNTIIGAIVGLVIAFAAFFIVNIVFEIFLDTPLGALELPSF